jgi:hypothetical protein
MCKPPSLFAPNGRSRRRTAQISDEPLIDGTIHALCVLPLQGLLQAVQAMRVAVSFEMLRIPIVDWTLDVLVFGRHRMGCARAY